MPRRVTLAELGNLLARLTPRTGPWNYQPDGTPFRFVYRADPSPVRYAVLKETGNPDKDLMPTFPDREAGLVDKNEAIALAQGHANRSGIPHMVVEFVMLPPELRNPDGTDNP